MDHGTRLVSCGTQDSKDRKEVTTHPSQTLHKPHQRAHHRSTAMSHSLNNIYYPWSDDAPPFVSVCRVTAAFDG
jgi:hypothetical protein